jgi:plasmid stabilization system protein ParE
MPYISLSRRAQSDLSRLYDFLAEHDSQNAQRAVATILDAFDRLTMPSVGAPVADRPGLRKLVIDFGSSGYVALYRYSPNTDTLRVLAMKHQKEDDYK